MDKVIERIFNLHIQIFEMMKILLAEKDKQLAEQDKLIKKLLEVLEKKAMVNNEKILDN